jgi:FkbM family methyltransferase
LVASLHWRTIERQLIGNGWSRYLIFPPSFTVPSALGNLLRDARHDPCQNPLFTPLFTPGPRQKNGALLAAAEKLLGAPEDRSLFRILTGRDEGAPLGPEAVAGYYYRSPLGRQYFDFVDYTQVDTLIEGGTADGGDTIAFLNAMPPGSSIFSFEPNRDAYRDSPQRRLLAGEPRVKIIPQGLWSRHTKLRFSRSGLSSRFLETADPVVESPETVAVTSIDRFVCDNSLGRIGFIKLDIEGAELEALRGAETTLYRDRPQLAVCLYHRPEHFYQIPLFLARVLPGYRHRLGHYSANHLETVWYAIPSELPAGGERP